MNFKDAQNRWSHTSNSFIPFKLGPCSFTTKAVKQMWRLMSNAFILKPRTHPTTEEKSVPILGSMRAL